MATFLDAKQVSNAKTISKFASVRAYSNERLYENGPVRFPDEQNQLKRGFTPSSDCQRSELPENITNTDFLSAIPYARYKI